MDVFIEALEELGHALVEHNHIWTNKQRRLYGRAHKEAERLVGRVSYGDCKDPEAGEEEPAGAGELGEREEKAVGEASGQGWREQAEAQAPAAA